MGSMRAVEIQKPLKNSPYLSFSKHVKQDRQRKYAGQIWTKYLTSMNFWLLFLFILGLYGHYAPLENTSIPVRK